MAWVNTGWKKNINPQGRSDYTFCLLAQTDYSLSGTTYTVSGRLLMLTTASFAPYANYSQSITFSINGVQVFNGSVREPTSTSNWSTSYAMAVDGTNYSRGVVLGSWSQNVVSSGPAISCPISATYSVSSSATYLPTTGTHSLSGSVSLPATFTYPYFTSFTANSIPSNAYTNMPYTYNIGMSCNYGSSTANNLLYVQVLGRRNNNYLLTSTTGTNLAAQNRTFTFPINEVDVFTLYGTIRYTDANGNIGYIHHTATYPIAAAYYSPYLSGVTHKTNITNYYRTSTVTTTSSATVTPNSAVGTQQVYTYFNAADATGDGSGKGLYKIGDSTFNNISKSYTHKGTNTGTFFTRLSLYGADDTNTVKEMATYGQVSYTMQPFVIPTATRTVTYNKHNVYVGQTKFPVTINVSAINKSQYDTLTPTFILGNRKNDNWSYDNVVSHAWATGVYNYTLTKIGSPYVVGDIASFCDEMTYKDVENIDATQQVVSNNYTVLEIPTPKESEIVLDIVSDDVEKTITGSIQGDFDSDFICYYTMYFENADGSIVYNTQTGTLRYNDIVSHTYKCTDENNLDYRVRIVCSYALVDEVNVSGGLSTFISDIVRVIISTKLYVKCGDNIFKFYLARNYTGSKLAVKYGNIIRYVPLFTEENLPSTEGTRMAIKNGSTIYYAYENYVPGGATHEYLSQFTHRYLGKFTHQEISDGKA